MGAVEGVRGCIHSDLTSSKPFEGCLGEGGSKRRVSGGPALPFLSVGFDGSRRPAAIGSESVGVRVVECVSEGPQRSDLPGRPQLKARGARYPRGSPTPFIRFKIPELIYFFQVALRFSPGVATVRRRRSALLRAEGVIDSDSKRSRQGGVGSIGRGPTPAFDPGQEAKAACFIGTKRNVSGTIAFHFASSLRNTFETCRLRFLKGSTFKQEEADYYLFQRFNLSFALDSLFLFVLAYQNFRNCLFVDDKSAFNSVDPACHYLKVFVIACM